jgi:putative ABC transport system substrate-binding protein
LDIVYELGSRRRLRSALVLLLLALSCFGVRADEQIHKVYRIAFVGATSPSTFPRSVTAFWDRLRELGYIEGQNLVVESRWAEGHPERLPALMSEVVQQKVDVIVTYGTPSGIAAKGATATIPIFDTAMGDPVASGLVSSLARPGGNLTGFSGALPDICGKWLELLQETIPRLSTVAVLAEPGNPAHESQVHELRSIAVKRGLKIVPVHVRESLALDQGMVRARRSAEALIVLSASLTMVNQGRIITLAAKHKLPAMYLLRDTVIAGGLLAYGPVIVVMFRRSADYVDRILKGARPADMPIEQPTQYILAVNLKTAKSLGLVVPQSILVRANEVVQ